MNLGSFQLQSISRLSPRSIRARGRWPLSNGSRKKWGISHPSTALLRRQPALQQSIGSLERACSVSAAQTQESFGVGLDSRLTLSYAQKAGLGLSGCWVQARGRSWAFEHLAEFVIGVGLKVVPKKKLIWSQLIDYMRTCFTRGFRTVSMGRGLILGSYPGLR